jgi:2-methylcitrate dehydratase PrpD
MKSELSGQFPTDGGASASCALGEGGDHMSNSLMDQICALVASAHQLDEGQQQEALTAFEDTFAVALAGWHEPVVQKVLPLYNIPAGATRLIDRTSVTSAEHAAFIHAVAGHALDYDDVHLVSVTHPSVVIAPAILAIVDARPNLAERALTAFALGVGVNIALGRALGFSHYDKGWHATSTIGGIAGAAALSHLLRLDATQTRHALALAAPQAGGLIANFGTMAKPVQAGFAAAAAVRAALMAEAGVTGATDIFAQRGFLDLYSGPVEGTALSEIVVELDTQSLSRKLFPCCYLTHRMIGAGIDLHAQLNGRIPADAVIDVDVPFGGMRPLHVLDPQTGLQGKFCAAYTIAAALLQGHVGLADFEDAAVQRAPIRAVMNQVRIHEEKLQGDMPVGIDNGVIRLAIRQEGTMLATTEVTDYPGSPADPATSAQIDAKLTDCLAHYSRSASKCVSLSAFRADLRRRLGLAVAPTQISEYRKAI